MVHILSIAVFTKNVVYIYIQKQDLKNSKKKKKKKKKKILTHAVIDEKAKILAFSSLLREKKKDINHSHSKLFHL